MIPLTEQHVVKIYKTAWGPRKEERAKSESIMFGNFIGFVIMFSRRVRENTMRFSARHNHDVGQEEQTETETETEQHKSTKL